MRLRKLTAILCGVCILFVTACEKKEKLPQSGRTDSTENPEDNLLSEIESFFPQPETQHQTFTNETESTAEALATEDGKPDEALFEYYDLLNEEYEKYGMMSIWGQNLHSERMIAFSSTDNTLLFCRREDNRSSSDKYYYIFSYDIDTKEKYYDGGYLDGWFDDLYMVHCNGRVLILDSGDWEQNHKIYVRDMHKWLNDISFADDDGFISRIGFQVDGTIYVGGYMISPDNTITELTYIPLQKEIEHGFTEDVSYTTLALYNNKEYVYSSDLDFCLCYFDHNTSTWEKTGVSITPYSNIKSIGKYLLTKYMIYDMETDEIVVEFNEFKDDKSFDFQASYLGGKHNLIQNSGRWQYIQYPCEGTQCVSESLATVDETSYSTTLYKLDDKYYVYEDKYGLFLRTYEKGAEEEEAIVYYDPEQLANGIFGTAILFDDTISLFDEE